MVKKLLNRIEKLEGAEKPVSLTVVPPEPGGQDIKVEVRRNLSAQKKRRQRAFVAFFFLVMGLMVFPMLKDGISYYRMSRKLESLKERNLELTNIRQELEREMALLNTPAMIEKLAREDLDMVRPGESKVYQAIPTQDIPQREDLKKGEALH